MKNETWNTFATEPRCHKRRLINWYLILILCAHFSLIYPLYSYADPNNDICLSNKDTVVQYLREVKRDLEKIDGTIQLKPTDRQIIEQLIKEKESFLERKSAFEAGRATHEKTTKQLESAERIATEKGLWGDPSVREQHRQAVIEQRLSSAQLYKEGSILQREGESIEERERRQRKKIDAYKRKQCVQSFLKQIAEPDRYLVGSEYGLTSMVQYLLDSSEECRAMINTSKLTHLRDELERCDQSATVGRQVATDQSEPDTVVWGILVVCAMGIIGVALRLVARRRVSPRL